MSSTAQVGDGQAIPESRVAHVENEIEVRAANIVRRRVGEGSGNETR